MRDTTATYQRLQTIIREPGCPICGLCQEAVTTFLDTLLWESSTDLNVSIMLDASLGFCGRHSRDLLDFGGQRLAAAVVERTSLLATIRRLPGLVATTPAPARFRLWPPRGRVQLSAEEHPDLQDGVANCPACVRQTHEEARGNQILLAHLEEFAGPLEAAGGLCLPHFVRAARVANGAQRATLLTLAESVWTDLAADLEEFIDKQKAHRRGESISEPARLAVERTIASLTGAYPAR